MKVRREFESKKEPPYYGFTRFFTDTCAQSGSQLLTTLTNLHVRDLVRNVETIPLHRQHEDAKVARREATNAKGSQDARNWTICGRVAYDFTRLNVIPHSRQVKGILLH